jgi:hypothetical protein
LVITTGCPVRATSSINCRHSALKTAAGISIDFSHMATMYGHYMPDKNRRNYSSTTECNLCGRVHLVCRFLYGNWGKQGKMLDCSGQLKAKVPTAVFSLPVRSAMRAAAGEGRDTAGGSLIHAVTKVSHRWRAPLHGDCWAM